MAPSIYDCSVDTELLEGTRLARAAIGRGELVVIPTDTVYGVAADAFTAAAVQRLLDAKGRGRQSPPPVLIPGLATLEALAEAVPQEVRDLAARFWPGGLTIVLPARASLAWDLGETKGTVALRVPKNQIALELLRETGPLAVSSANLTGRTAARTAREAADMLGDSVAVYLDGGEAGADYEPEAADLVAPEFADLDIVDLDAPTSPNGATQRETASTIVDATALAAGTGGLRILRHGVITADQIRLVVGAHVLDEDSRHP